MTIQPSLVKLDAACREAGGFAIAGADDIFPVGPRGVVLPAVVAFAEEVKKRCGLTLQWSKTEYFCWEGGLPEDAPTGLRLASRLVDGEMRRGFLCWGVPVGEKEYVAAVLDEKVMTIVEEARQSLGQLMEQHKQSAWAALKWSVWARFEYLAGLCYPSDSIPAAKELDRQLWSLLQGVCGSPIPHTTSLATRSCDCSLQLEMPGREDWTFSAWVERQPFKLGGMGPRSHAEQCRLAFYSMQEQVLPQLYMGFCPLLEPVAGGTDVFVEASSEDDRWGTLLQSGPLLGREFRNCWEAMQQEAKEGAVRLGEEEVIGPLGKDAVSGGEGSCTGGKDSTRAKIQDQRERMMGRLLTDGLLHHPDPEARPVWSWPDRDKLSRQWLLALPGHDTSLHQKNLPRV